MNEESSVVFDSMSALPNKLLQDDGSITDIIGREVVSDSLSYASKRALPNKFLNPDGSYSTLNEIIASAIDTDLFIVVDELPETGDPQKIYLVPDDEGGFIEYHYVDGVWDEIGIVDIDLSNYPTIDDMEQYVDDAPTFKPFPNSFVTNSTTQAFFNSVTQAHPKVGMVFLGGVTFSDLPTGVVNAEVELYVYSRSILLCT